MCVCIYVCVCLHACKSVCVFFINGNVIHV